MSKCITAILVSYNSGFILEKSLAPLLKAPEIAHIIVVDNHSRDNTCALITQSFPEVELIQNSKNAGFGQANNIALAKVTTPYALIINPDAFLDADALPALIKATHSYPDAAILAPQLRDVNGKILHSHRPDIFSYNNNRKYYQKIHAPEGDICSLSFITGAVWLVNMELLRKTGFYDPSFFLYYEDDDLCIRCRDAGFSVILVQNAGATHLVNSSCGIPAAALEIHRSMRQKQSFVQVSRLRIEQKYKGRMHAYRLAAQLALRYTLSGLLCRISGHKLRYNYYIGRLTGISRFILT